MKIVERIKDFFGSSSRNAPVVAEEPQAIGENRYSTRYGSAGGEKWPSGLSSSGRLQIVNHSAARRNARNAMQDSLQARTIVERFADTVAGDGLKLEITPNIEVLGISREEAEKWSRDVEARFDLWATDKRQHRSENLNFYQAQRLYAMFQQRDNDIFVRLYYDSDPVLQNPLQYEFIDPDQIRGDAITTMGGAFSFGNGITSTYGMQTSLYDGIKRDERGREMSYSVYLRNEADGTYKTVEVPAMAKNGRKLMIHGFRPEYAGQGRGYSRLSHAVQEFENITDFSAAAIKKAIAQSCIVGFVEPAKNEDANNPFEGMLTNQGAGPAGDMFGVDNQPSTTDPEPAPEQWTGVTESYQVPEATMDVPGSMFITNLTKGSTIKFAANTAPGDSFDKFVDAFASHLSASLGIPLEVVLMKFGNNYSASRATLLLFWRVAGGWVCEMDADFLSPVVEMWLSEEIAAGHVIAPGWSDPRMRAAWMSHGWVGSPPPDIDPAKSARARRDNVEIGVTNLEREARDLNGSSAAANIQKNKQLYKDFQLAPWAEQGNFPEGSAPQTATPQPAKKAKALFARLEELLDEFEGS